MNLKTSLDNAGKVDHFGWVKCIFRDIVRLYALNELENAWDKFKWDI